MSRLTRDTFHGRLRRARPSVAFLSITVLVGVVACRRKAPLPAANGALASASASASATPVDEASRTRCHIAPSPGLRAALGAVAPAASAEEGDDGIGLPFSPEVGGATPVADGDFLVGVLETSKEATNAAVLHLSANQATSKRIDLGKVHGDVLAPRVVARADKTFVAVADGAPNGSILRFAKIDDATGDGRVTWGVDLPQGNDESDAFAIELGDKSLLSAWDEWDAKDGHSVVKTAAFPAFDISKAPPSVVVSAPHEDAEAPALAARPSGFWSAWITNAKREPDKKERAEASETSEPVDMGPRWISIEPLDAGGKPTGAPVSVTPKTGHVQGFDLAPGRDGSALVVWREDTTSPATPGGAVRIASVRPDGSVDLHPVDDDDVGAGVPGLLVDDAPPAGAPAAWLSIAGEADAARFAALDADGRTLEDVAPDSTLGAATPLAVRGGRFLVLRPRGRGVELEVLACGKKELAGAPVRSPP